jgi:NADH-quinone oxidoreductase subunit L
MLLSETALPDPIFALVPWVVLIPVIGLLINLLFGRRFNEKLVGLVASLASGGAFVVAVLLALALSRHPEGVTLPVFTWMAIDNLQVDWSFRVDTLSSVMMLVVSGVGTLIHIYAIGYMHSDVRHNGEPSRFRRFFVYLNLFIAMMMILVTASNYLVLFVGWEGVGLCSYLLIGFWFEKGKDGLGNAKAAKKAFTVNRIGDFGLLIALFVMFFAFKSFDFETVFAAAPAMASAIPWVLVAMTLFMLLGVTGKSAQIPLYVWLPDAMAGPTPVSALIHAATMVTAGVYLVARSAPLYELVPTAQNIVAWVGALTAIFAATIAVGQTDIKKVLAYSTISQLGFMVAAVGMGAFVAGIFHLVTHAFFKALLFLAAGSVILGMEHGAGHGSHGQGHNEEDPQDMRNMGGLRKKMPVTFWVYLFGALALAGVAPLAGFFSKDEILTAASSFNPAIFILLILAAFLTAFYMGRQVLMVFFGQPRTKAAQHAVESPAVVTVPLIILAVLSVLGGGLNLPGVHTLGKWLEHTLHTVEEAHFVWAIAGGSLAVALLGILIAWLLYGRKPLTKVEARDPLASRLGVLFTGMAHKWWMDELYQKIIIRPFEIFADFLTHPVDLGVIDGIGNGLGKLTRTISAWWSRYQSGFVRTYALTFLLGVVTVLGYFAYLALR